MKTAFIKLALCSMLAAACSAQAANFATQYGSGRVRVVEYQQDLVVEVTGYMDNPTVLEFPADEPVQDVAGGLIVNWDINMVANRVFMSPLDGAKSGTTIVVTDKNSYVFDLVPARSGASKENRVSKIVLQHPKEEEEKNVGEVDPTDIAGPKNLNYSMEVVNASVDIRPAEVFDNGTFTFFKFPRHVEIPAIYKATPNAKEEWLVNSHRQGEYIVVQSVAAQWNLRLENAVIGVFNDSFGAASHKVTPAVVPPVKATAFPIEPATKAAPAIKDDGDLGRVFDLLDMQSRSGK